MTLITKAHTLKRDTMTHTVISGMPMAQHTHRPQSILSNQLHTTTNQHIQRIQDIHPTLQLKPHHITTTMVTTPQLTQHQLTLHQLTRRQPTTTIQQPLTHTTTATTTMVTTKTMAMETTGIQHMEPELICGSLDHIELFNFS
jgi:hypothetical protein